MCVRFVIRGGYFRIVTREGLNCEHYMLGEKKVLNQNTFRFIVGFYFVFDLKALTSA